MGRTDQRSTFFEVFFSRAGEFGGDELKAAFLEAGEDLADETTINAVGLMKMLGSSNREMRCGYLDHDVCAFADVDVGGCHDLRSRWYLSKGFLCLFDLINKLYL